MTDSIISGDLRRRLYDWKQTGEREYVCRIDFSPSFRGFAGHFEGNPVVPGVCLIELVRVCAENVLKKNLKTDEILQCKFRSPALAGTSAQCKLSIRPENDGKVKIQAEVRAGENIACQMRLKAGEI